MDNVSVYKRFVYDGFDYEINRFGGYIRMSFIKEVTIYERKEVRVYICQCHNKGKKTKCFAIRRDDNTGLADLLGLIEWSGRWWQYVFTPLKQSTIWSAGCMNNIVLFMQEQNQKQRERFRKLRTKK